MASRPVFLRTKDVAHLLDMSPDEVVLLARNRKLSAIKEGRYWKFSWANVERYKRKHASA